MIRRLVDFSLDNRFIVLSLMMLLFIWGAIAFKTLPVEAYPDVANTWVQIITQWPGRAAEEVEQQVTVPIEIQMNGMPHLQHVRSASLSGLSVVNLIFDDDSDNDKDRQKVLEHLAQVTLPPNVSASVGPDFSPIGSIYWYTIESSNPAYDVMELKSIQDWVIAKYLKSVPDVVDDSSFGGITREYQIRIDPDKLISYGLSLAQVEQQLTNANANAGGSFIEQGSQQINVRAVGLVRNVADIEKTVIKTQNGTALRIKDIATVAQGPKIRLGQIGKAVHRKDGVVVDDGDVVEGIVFLRKGADTAATLDGIHATVRRLNQYILPPGVKIVPYLDRDDLVHYTTHTVLHNLAEGMILVVIILFMFLGNARGAIIVALTIPFALLFASICLDLRHISANLLSLGALDFGMVVDGSVVMVENIVRHLQPPRGRDAHAAGKDSQRGARSAAARFLRDRHHHHCVSSDLHSATSRREALQADGVDGGVRAAGSTDLLNAVRACAGKLPLPGRRQTMGKPGHEISDGSLPEKCALGGAQSLVDGGSRRRRIPMCHLPGVWRCNRLGILAAPGRRRDLGARDLGSQHRTDGKRARRRASSSSAGFFSRGSAGR